MYTGSTCVLIMYFYCLMIIKGSFNWLNVSTRPHDVMSTLGECTVIDMILCELMTYCSLHIIWELTNQNTLIINKMTVHYEVLKFGVWKEKKIAETHINENNSNSKMEDFTLRDKSGTTTSGLKMQNFLSLL